MTFDTRRAFNISASIQGDFYSLPALGKALGVDLLRLPVCIRIVLESILRHCDGKKITQAHVKQLAHWNPKAPRKEEIPFIVARVVLQDFTGVPLLADLAAMRNVAQNLGKDPHKIEPLVPVDLVVDHSIQVDHFRKKHALDLNMILEFQRNHERYQFIKWGMQAFDTFGIVPPGFGIVHQVNLEYLARGVYQKEGVYYPDTLVGTDSHTTMINALGVVAWGVGGIEAEAAMLGQPLYFLTPDVVGVHLTGCLREGVTATDLVLTITQLLRQAKVVGKFVEFFGEGAASLSLTDRATLANMAPEYGATMGFFPVDEATLDYFRYTGRPEVDIQALEAYFKAQALFGIPCVGEIDYTFEISLDLSTVSPSLAGPRRPQDRIELAQMRTQFTQLFRKPVSQNGFNKKPEDLDKTYQNKDGITVKNGDVLIAAITSCTNTSNPSVLITAGLLAKKAVEAGLSVAPHIKTSLAPGSRVVTKYLEKTGLLPYLEKLGFALVGYGCTTCIGNSGDLTPAMNEVIASNQLIACAVLSGNRNFEARIHPSIHANFLASPPLVIAFAIAGNMNRDLMSEPVGHGKDKQGKPCDIYLGDIWPSAKEVDALMAVARDPTTFKENYADIKRAPGKLWESIELDVPASSDQKRPEGVYHWPNSTYIAQPPFFESFDLAPNMTIANIVGARALAIFGDSITTDHISPAGAINESSPAGQWLTAHGVLKADFNSYGSRRGHHDIMVRGTFANVRIKNLMVSPLAAGERIEGGVTRHQPTGEPLSIYDAAMRYCQDNIPTMIFAGEEYGTGSSRDWAAKGTRLLGIRAVFARSFERIHRANLVGMGVLPCQFLDNDSVQSLSIIGDERFDLEGLDQEIVPQQYATLVIHRLHREPQRLNVLLRIDTPIEVDYYKHGGILPFVLRQLLTQ